MIFSCLNWLNKQSLWERKNTYGCMMRFRKWGLVLDSKFHPRPWGILLTCSIKTPVCVRWIWMDVFGIMWVRVSVCWWVCVCVCKCVWDSHPFWTKGHIVHSSSKRWMLIFFRSGLDVDAECVFFDHSARKIIDLFWEEPLKVALLLFAATNTMGSKIFLRRFSTTHLNTVGQKIVRSFQFLDKDTVF